MLVHIAGVLCVRVLAGVVVLLSYLLVARVLGAAEAGLYFLAFTVVTVVSAVARLGLDSSLVRFIAAFSEGQQWNRVNGIVRLAIIVVTLFSVAVASLICVLAGPLADLLFRRPALDEVLRVAALAIPFVTVSFLLGRAYMGLHAANRSIFLQNIGVALLFCGLFGMAWLLLPKVSAVTAAGCLVIGSAVLALMALWSWYRQAWTAWSGDEMRAQLLATSTPLWVVTIMNMVGTWGGQLASAPWLTPEEYAGFAVAQRLSHLIGVTLSIVNMVAAPRFAAMHHKGDMASVAQVAQFSLRVSLLLAVPAVVVLCIAPGWFLALFGPGFSGAAPALVMLVLAQLFNVAAGSTGFLLTMTGHEQDARNIAVFSGVLTVPLSLVLTMGFGLPGAAVAIAAILVIQNLMQVLVVRRRLGFNPMDFRRR